MLLVLVQIHPQRWWVCGQRILRSVGTTWGQKLRLMALVVLAVKLIRLSQLQGWRHVHVHSCANAAHIAMFAATLADLSYSLTLHNPLAVYGPDQQQKWQYAKFGIVITQQIYQEVTQTLANHLPARLDISPMGVNNATFTRYTPYQPVTTDTIRLFSCGRLNPCKGYFYLIMAVQLLCQQGLPVSLTIAGEDEQGGSGYRQDLEQLIADLELQAEVKLLGAVAEEVVKTQLEIAHIFVLASLAEPLGVAIMEAMAMEVPVVATWAGGVPELIDYGVEGILVPPEDPEAIAKAIQQIVQDPSLAQQLGQAGRQKVIQQFSYRRSAQVLANLLRD